MLYETLSDSERWNQRSTGQKHCERMRGVKRKTTSLNEGIRNQLGLSPSPHSSRKRSRTRKEIRKELRAAKRQKSRPTSSTKQKQEQPKLISEDPKPSESTKPTKKQRTEPTRDRPSNMRPEYVDPEDEEIARLEKLLGVSKKDKKKSAKKLNKEFELYEGISGNLGDFLLKLDDLSSSMCGGGEGGEWRSILGGSDIESDNDDMEEKHHIIDDSEQEVSDVDYSDDEDEEEEEMEEGNETESLKSKNAEEIHADVYRPRPGEDIYGRPVTQETSAVPGKYVPPARRNQQPEKQTNIIAEDDEKARMIRRIVNGQLNRLSEQSRDSVLRAIADVFRENSFTITCTILKECLIAVCANTSQLMTTLVPHYAALVAALHFSVHSDIGAYMVEALTVKLVQEIEGGDTTEKSHALISSKVASNVLVLLVYLYNLRVVQHRLVMDILTMVVRGNDRPMSEQRAELALCVVEHCGPSLRSDDPQGLRQVVLEVQQRVKQEQYEVVDGRVRFMLEALADLKNNKSRRTQTANAEMVAALRKWVGRAKVAARGKINGVSGAAESGLKVSLQDLLQAETVGRWWRAGAYWGGAGMLRESEVDYAGKEEKQVSGARSSTDHDEEQKLLKLAKKLHMNTSVRRNIFVVLMSSRDTTDAFERLSRLDLKGKQDREVIRVIATCCGLENTYNEFYAELATVFCLQNRQNRTTLQFVFWDLFKVLTSPDEAAMKESSIERKAINMARMLACLVSNFQLSLSVLKVIDMADLSSQMMLFLATFFLALFSVKITEEAFAGVLDRVATTSDCLAVRENVLVFLQRHLTDFPSGLPKEELKIMQKRRLKTIRTMEAMSVLDIAKGLSKDKTEQHDDYNADFGL